MSSAAAGPPPRSRGVIALLEANCTSCMLCVRECPDWCITIDSHTEGLAGEADAAPARRERSVNVLDRFAIDYSLCMYCGICVEVCPFDALFWAPAYGYPAGSEGALTHERERLAGWTAEVPPPQAPAGAGRPGTSGPPRSVAPSDAPPTRE